MELKSFFNKLSEKLQLGRILGEPTRVIGGFMHMMYRIDTSCGAYIVKLLVAEIMKRLTAMGNFLEAERLELILEKNNIPIISAIMFNGKKMQEIEGQYFYVFDWYDGHSLKGKDISKFHCEKISKVLYLIHNIEVKKEKYERNKINIDWEKYICMAKEQKSPICALLESNKQLLIESQERGNIAIENMPDVITICHNDMDSKNVLWQNDEFRIIDLECLTYSNPYLELFELALCWSGYEECKIDFELFRAFFQAYLDDKPKQHINWEAVYYSNFGRLEWLEYNIKRALMIECETAETQQLGIGQVIETVGHVVYYNNVKDEILSCIAKI